MSNYANITASAAVKTGTGMLVGMYINSTNAGTIKLNDGTSGTASAGVKATQTITASGVFSDTETVTVGNTVYTMVTALSSATYEVLIGASAAASLDNIKSAINGTAGEGTTYSYGTEAHTSVIATTNAATTQVIEAISLGTASNAIATTETGANSAWGAATMTGGVDTNILMNNTITPAIGYHELGDTSFVNGLYATIAGTALDVTLYFK